uniref:Uncharacterized protein n=1 Tax=Bicosoecida sp. CB-2014 TaxID=1486930 RepID=A0A7S1G8X7_9STRA
MAVERPPDIDLLPPRFSPLPNPLDRLHVAPVDWLVGRGALHDLLSTHLVGQPRHAAFGGLAASGVVGPGWAHTSTTPATRDALEEASLAAIGANSEIGDRPSGVFDVELGMAPTVDDNPPIVGLLVSRAANTNVAATLSKAHVAGGAPFWSGHLVVGAEGDARVRTAVFMPGAGVGLSGAVHVTPAAGSAGLLAGVRAGGRYVTRGGGMSIGGSLDMHSGGEAFVTAAGESVRAGVRLARGLSADSPIAGVAAASLFRRETRGGDGQPSFEVGITGSLDGKRAIVSYMQRLVVRRGVINPLAESHVKGIYNYVDVGFALQHGDSSAFAIASSAQINKNLLIKAKATASHVSASAVIKTWVDPQLTLAVGTRYSMDTGVATPGVTLALNMGSRTQFEQPASSAVRRVGSRHIEALETTPPGPPEAAFPSQAPGTTNVPSGDGVVPRDDVSERISAAAW